MSVDTNQTLMLADVGRCWQTSFATWVVSCEIRMKIKSIVDLHIFVSEYVVSNTFQYVRDVNKKENFNLRV